MHAPKASGTLLAWAVPVAFFLAGRRRGDRRWIVLAALGAEFLLTPADRGTDGAIERAYELAAEEFGPSEESLESRLFDEDEIPWDEIAFRSGTFALKKYFEDRGENNGVHIHELRRIRR